jgi:hypothetical protein
MPINYGESQRALIFLLQCNSDIGYNLNMGEGIKAIGIMINISDKKLAVFCQHHHISHLALFGSVLRDDFQAGSDVDVLVVFEPSARVGFLALGQMKRELEDIFQRRVDLVPQDGLKPIIRDEMLASATEIYAA